MANYNVKFEASPKSTGQPTVTAQNLATHVTYYLPWKLSSGAYSIVWLLQGNPGTIAPGTITATSVAITKAKKTRKKAARKPRVASVPPVPIGVTPNGQPKKVINGVAHDVIPMYTLP